MHRFITRVLLSILLFTSACFAADTRVFEFNYEVLPTDLPDDQPVDIYLPVPTDQPGQVIVAQEFASRPAGALGTETEHGNAYYHIHRPAGDSLPVTAHLRWTVSRSVSGIDADTSVERDRLFLQPNRLVPVGHEILEPILAEIRAQRASDSPADTARAIYDWLVDNVEYKKAGTGWGNGDTFWACSERYGNCTDFHALFISLARTEGIPARFEIGFPVPDNRPEGQIGGYHCWVRFHLPGQGWLPIDASEAAKDPARRELFYGTQPTDRIQFTTGRDLVLSPGSARQPLNYFIYPYVEVGGAPWKGKLPTRFSYRDAEGLASSTAP